MKRPFVSLWLVACFLFSCLAALEGLEKKQETVGRQQAADLKAAAGRIGQGTIGKQAVACASWSMASARDSGNASLHHLRRLDESETFLPMPVRAEQTDTTLQSMYPGGGFLASLWPASLAEPVQAISGNGWTEPFGRLADWLQSLTGKSFSYPLLNGF